LYKLGSPGVYSLAAIKPLTPAAKLRTAITIGPPSFLSLGSIHA
jgi:hypothetical protein